MRNAIITILSVLFIDQAIKIWVKSNTLLHDMVGEFGFIKIQFIENPGMAFGWSGGGVWGKIALTLFRLFAVVLIGFVIRNLINNKAHKGLQFSVALIFAGALGNILDSAFYGFMFDSGTTYDVATNMWVPYDGVSQINFEGYAGFLQGCVVDMIHFQFYWPEWMPWGLGGQEVFPPVFNIADAAISCGVVIIILFNKRFFGSGKGNFDIFRKNPKSLQEEENQDTTVSNETANS